MYRVLCKQFVYSPFVYHSFRRGVGTKPLSTARYGHTTVCLHHLTSKLGSAISLHTIIAIPVVGKSQVHPSEKEFHAHHRFLWLHAADAHAADAHAGLIPSHIEVTIQTPTQRHLTLKCNCRSGAKHIILRNNHETHF